jgi:cytochrome c
MLSSRLCDPALGFAALMLSACAAESELPTSNLMLAGKALAQANCSRCHAIGLRGRSPLPKAPPFRTLHERYPVEHLAEAFGEGIVVGHTEMPNFVLQPQQVEALVAYLKSLEPGNR